jgi:Tol biopolymer transport system component/DNA-binding winged helix-turn-helix (wHTH) protein
LSAKNHFIYEFGPFRLDAQKRLLLREGEIVPLKPKAFDILLTLVEGNGQVVDKDELMKRVWPDTAVEEGNLTFNMSRLRKALGDDPRRHEYIVTIPGEGYQFVAGVRATFDELVVHESTSITVEEVEEVPDRDSRLTPGKIAPSSIAKSTSQAVLAPGPQAASGNRKTYWLVAALLVFVAVTAVGLYWIVPRRAQTPPVPFREMTISRVTTSGKTTRAAISPDGQYVAHVTVETAGDSLWVRHVGAPTSLRIAGPSAAQFFSVRFATSGDSVYYVALDRNKGESVLYRVPVLGGPSTVVANDVNPPDFSPDGKQMAFVRSDREDSRLVVANSDGSNERTLALRQNPEYFRDLPIAPAWSPDGKTIASPASLNDQRGQYETVLCVSVKDGSQRTQTSARWNYIGQPVWLADGSGMLVTAAETSTTPIQIWHISLASGEATQITNDLNSYTDLSLNADSTRLAAVQINAQSSIWIAPEGDAGRAKQIATDTGWIQEMAWTPNGRIVYRSNAGGAADIWIMDTDGSNARQLTTGARANRGLAVSPDGRYILFSSDRGGRFNIWRVNADGSNLKQLTNGDYEVYPQCTRDSTWVVYQRGIVEPRLWKVPVDGGEAVQLTATRAIRPSISPNGELIAYHYLDPEMEKSQWSIGVVSIKGGSRLKRFDLPPTVTSVERVVRWSPDGASVTFPNSLNGLSDIWLQPLNGSPPKQLTHLKAEQIQTFEWSPDGRTLALIRGVETRDVVLIEKR